MAADVPSILARLATIEPEVLNPINSVPTYAYASVPFSLNTNDLPSWVNLPGPMVEDWEVRVGEDSQAKEGLETREFHCTLYIAPAAAGKDGELFAVTEPYFALCRDMFQSHQSLKALDGIQRVNVLGDGGSQVLPFAGVPYYAIRFRVQIVSRVRVALATGE